MREDSVFTIPPGISFVDALAEGLLQRHGPDGDGRLDKTVIFLPTRRAVRSLQTAFLRSSAGQALILPVMRPLGDIDENEPPLTLLDPVDEPELPPAVDRTERLWLLTRLVQKGPISVAGIAEAVGLADQLGQLIDRVKTERLDFDDLKDLVPDDYQDHWQKTLRFLQIVIAHWPDLLAERQAMDAAERRDRLLALLADRWRRSPPDIPVYIAGSTGSVPGTADLMHAIASAPGGALVLPGFQHTTDADDLAAIRQELTHPQYGMLHLLDRLDLRPEDVRPWPAGGAGAENTPRLKLLSEAMRPSETSDRWQELRANPIPETALQGLRLIEAPGPREEAGIIALMMRETLETPGRTTALVTPDRNLARRVGTELARFGIPIDDSAGRDLRQTAVGTFMRHCAELVSGRDLPLRLLALLKHPLAAAGGQPSHLRLTIRTLERLYFRGIVRWRDLDELQQLIASDGRVDLPDWLPELARQVSLISAVFDHPERTAEFTELLRAQIVFCEWMATTDQDAGDTILWQGEAGDVAAGLLRDLLSRSGDAPDIPREEWPAIFDRLLDGALVRPAVGTHPRIAIYGPLEARLQSVDRIILGGLNEGTWPGTANVDPWMSRPMRADFGLPLPERRIGLQAHDFVQMAAGTDVVLTRATKADGAPTVPSRWLMRLGSVTRAAGLELKPDQRPVTWLQALDTPKTVTPCRPPTPRPPVKARPRTLPVTAVETLIRDPYAIYARRILNLRPLDGIDEAPDPRLRGTVIHHVLEAQARNHQHLWRADHQPEMQALMEQELAGQMHHPAVQVFWLQRFGKAIAWLLMEESSRNPDVRARLPELTGQLKFPELKGFTLTATADRIDQMQDGTARILDYKTGAPPSAKQIAAGFAVQLPLEMLIAEAGGFKDLGAAQISELVHIQLNGAGDGGRWVPVRVKDQTLAEVASDARDGLVRLMGDYLKPETAYLSRPRIQFTSDYNDYDHLARIAEWSVAGAEAEGDA